MDGTQQTAHGATVFIVDDDAMVRRALARLLHSAGHQAETFESARAFLARTPAAEQGIVLLDVCMPGRSGPELQQDLLDRGSRLEILFMSALDDAHVRERVLVAGARAWLTKPVDAEQLLALLSGRREMRQGAG
ncbi:MAG: response regulator [Planctomycetes bacterium]|nr:response regulator [Planctomycetota bacterium]